MTRTVARAGKALALAAIFAAGISVAGVATGVGPLCSDSLLCISKGHSPSSVTSGEGPITYTVAVSNGNTIGDAPAPQQEISGVTVFDQLGPGQTLQSLDGACSAGDPIECPAGQLGPGDSATFTIVAGPVTTGTVTNSAWAKGDTCGDGCIDTTPTVEDSVVVLAASANLVVAKSDSPDPVATGGHLTYSVVVSNTGQGTARNVQLTDDLPNGALDGANSTTQGSCSAPPSDPVVCSLGDIGPGASVTVTIEVKAPDAPGTITNTATAACGGGGGTGPNQAAAACEASDSEDTLVQAAPPPPPTTEQQRSADVSIAKSAGAARLAVGQPLTYTLRTANSGPETATAVVVTDLLPDGAALVSAAASKGSCAGSTRVTCSLGSLARGESATVTIVVTFAAPGEYDNTARVSADQADPDTSNQSSSLTTLVLPAEPEPPGSHLDLLGGPDATFAGHGGYSADGMGRNGGGGQLRADVPAGSAVTQAYLYGSYFVADPSAAERTIDLDGTSVLLTKLATANGFLTSARADVTAQVAAKVGGGGALTSFTVGNDPQDLDGLALLVLYSNPALPETTIAVLDGAAIAAGNTVGLQFSTGLDTAASGFSARMTLGIGHSTQGSYGHVCGTGAAQSTLVRVNDHPLTSCAGGYDDGVGNAGGRVTVGGVGDNPLNPADPSQRPADGAVPRVEDDELYDLAPFVSNGDTELDVTTTNPPQTDLLFLNVIAVTAKAVVLQPKFGKTVVADVVDGDVSYRTPSSKTFLPLTEPKELPVNTEYDTTHGVMQLTSAVSTASTARASTPKTQTARFYDGRFVARQARVRNAYTELVLTGGNLGACPRKPTALHADRPGRKLWGKGKGKFKTKGKYSSSAVRGTWWLTQDRCNGTLTVVRQGVVAVVDFGKHKTILVKAGKRYLAKPKAAKKS